MGRFILRYEGAGPMPSGDAERLRALPGVRLVNQSSRMILVEAPAKDSLQSAVDALGNWSISTEHSVPLPPTHPDLGRSKPKPPR